MINDIAFHFIMPTPAWDLDFVVKSIILRTLVFSIPVLRGLRPQSGIARFDPIQNTWTKLGDLKQSAVAHRVIQVDNDFIVFGGLGNKYAESCIFDGQKMTCTKREPQLTNFNYLELILIQ